MLLHKNCFHILLLLDIRHPDEKQILITTLKLCLGLIRSASLLNGARSTPFDIILRHASAKKGLNKSDIKSSRN